MDPVLIALLIFSLLLAALLFHFTRSTVNVDPVPWVRTARFLILAVMIPIILTTLLLQAGAEQRLENTGFKVHPALNSSAGLSVGLGENPVWVFSSTASAESIRGFYEQPENRSGWMPAIYTGNALLYKQDGFSMSILVDGEQVVFALLRDEWPR